MNLEKQIYELRRQYDELAATASSLEDLNRLEMLEGQIAVAEAALQKQQEEARRANAAAEAQRKERLEAEAAELARKRAIQEATRAVQRTAVQQQQRLNQQSAYPSLVIEDPAPVRRRNASGVTRDVQPISNDRRDLWTGAPRSNDADLEESMIYAAYLVRDLPGVQTIERTGNWLWLKGETYAIKEELKAAGFHFSEEKTRREKTGVWWWSPDNRRPRNYRGTMPMSHIYAKYGRDVLKDDE